MTTYQRHTDYSPAKLRNWLRFMGGLALVGLALTVAEMVL